MSIYIDMEMPTNCDVCWALDDYGDYPRCRITEEQRGYNFPIREKRMDNCPLVPVSAHGRLGDMDAIARKIRRLGDYVDFTKDEIAGWFENGDFETIIPATNKK